MGGAPACPDPFPGVYAPCSDEGEHCTAPLACCGGEVVCQNNLWIYVGPSCDGCPTDCGPEGFGCVAGALCVVHLAFTTTYTCEPNPCGGAPTCACAEPLCDAWDMDCNNTSGNEVYCDCINC